MVGLLDEFLVWAKPVPVPVWSLDELAVCVKPKPL